MTLLALSDRIDQLNEKVGRLAAWMALAMVLCQFGVVLLRYVFGIGFIWLQESVLYLHGLLFLLGVGYSLLHDGHVRVDIFYRDASRRKKAWVDLFGSTFLLSPFIGLITYYSFSYVVNSWEIFEGSPDPAGIHAIFILKSAILVYCGLLGLQGLSLAAKSILILKGRADGRD